MSGVCILTGEDVANLSNKSRPALGTFPLEAAGEVREA
jgi:hypothetical protein